MTRKKILILVAIFALVGVFAFGRSTFAKDGMDDMPDDNTSDMSMTDDSSDNTSDDSTDSNDSSKTDDSTDDSTTMDDRIAEHRAEIEDRIKNLQEHRKERLSTKRLHVCEDRQDRINEIFSNATDRNKKQLEVFKKIQTLVENFYEDKGLSASGYDAAVTNANDKMTAAQAAIDASEGLTFDCNSADGAHPGSVIREAMKSRHTALKAYRTAVKDLIVLVKQSLDDKENQ